MKLYKLDSKGKVREIDIYAKDGELYQVSGLVDGKKVTNIRNCKGKNLGKANETTPIEQAKKEQVSKITQKIREGYHISIEDAKNCTLILPMLAKSHDDHGHKVVWPCYGQPKYDGIRMLGKEDKRISRKNKDITTLDHIKLTGIETFIDGEVYAHGYTFQENTKLIKKYRPNETEKIQYVVYDLVSDKPFKERLDMLLKLIDPKIHKNVKVAETIILNNQKELDDYHALNLERGYEGTIIRWGDTPYKANGRSENLLKYKNFYDIALPCIDIVESNRVPGNGIVVIEYNGHRIRTNSKISHADRADLWTNRHKYIGKETCEIRYFEETDKGGLRFPVFHGFRIDK